MLKALMKRLKTSLRILLLLLYAKVEKMSTVFKTKIKDITPGANGRDYVSQSVSSQSDVVEGNPSTTIIRENSEKSTENDKKSSKNSSSRKSLDEVEEEMQKVRAVRSMLEGDVDEKEVKKDIDNNTSSRYNIIPYRSILEISEQDYVHHYWAFANNLIEDRSEWGVFSQGISDIKNGLKYPKDNKLYMIPTEKYEGMYTIYNKIIFTDGKFENPSIECVLVVDKNFSKTSNYIGGLFDGYRNGYFTERDIVEIVENYYGETSDVARLYRSEDFPNLQELKEQERNSRNVTNSSRGMSNGRGTSSKAGRYSIDVNAQNNETDIEIVRSTIYEFERNWTRTSNFYEDLFGKTLIRKYQPETFGNYQAVKAEWRRRSGGSQGGEADGADQQLQNGRGTSSKAGRYSLDVNAQNNETGIEIVRSAIYEREKSWTRQSNFYANLYEEELVREYAAGTFQNYQEIKRTTRERSGGRKGGGADGADQQLQNGGGTSSKAGRYSIDVNAQNNETEIEIVRGFIYESKGIVDENYFDWLLKVYNAEDFQYGAQRTGSRKDSGTDRYLQNGRGTSSKAGRYSIDVNAQKLLLIELRKLNIIRYLRRFKNMAGVAESSPYRAALIELICSINNVIPLKEENQVLIMIQLDTEEKISRFNQWIGTKLTGENELNTTEIEIMHVTAQISKGVFHLT